MGGKAAPRMYMDGKARARAGGWVSWVILGRRRGERGWFFEIWYVRIGELAAVQTGHVGMGIRDLGVGK